MHKLHRFFTILAVLVTAIVAPFGVQSALAVRPDSLKDTLSDSRPSIASNHTIILDLSVSTAFAANETVIVTFPAGYDLTALTMTDVDFLNGATDETLQAGACGATDSVRYVLASQVITFTACTTYSAEAAGTAITIKLGSNATGGTIRIVNTTAGTSQLNVAGTHGDDAQDTVLVITAAITISATIDETLTNTVAAIVSGSCTTLGGTTITSTATTIPYAAITAETFYDICQQLTVATNAAGGYTVTVYTVAGLDSGANAFAVGSCDGGGCTLTTPNTWATATNNGYAICMDDSTGDGAATANAGWDTAAEQCGGAGQKFELVADASAAQTQSTIMSSAVGVTDIALVSWRLSADATQAAGAYTGTTDYVATGTF